MTQSIQTVQPPLEFIPPDLNLPVLRGIQALLPMILKTRTTITDIQAQNVETLVTLLDQFQSGKLRILLAFRHPSIDDPFCLAYLLSRLVPQTAKQMNVRLKKPLHAHFIYDRGIPLWAGHYAGWVMSKVGATPIQRGKLDRVGLKSARNLFLNGLLPMAAAPEGATNGHSEIVSPLEPGISQMGFWCLEDLRKAGRDEDVAIVPIGIQYHYVTPPWEAIDRLLTELETCVGIPAQATSTSEAVRYQRLLALGGHVLRVMEDFYRRFHHQSLPNYDQPPQSNQEFADRLKALMDVGLKVAESHFDLQSKGSVIDRCRRLEQAAWDCIYREDIKQIDALSPLERGLADRVAEEADQRIWHMRLVESFVAVTGKYILEKPTAERFAEMTLITWTTIHRIKGTPSIPRPKLGAQRAVLTVGEPIRLGDRADTYQSSRKAAKQCVDELTQELQSALIQMVQ